MRKNVGSNDRWIRILIGSALIFWVLFANGSIWGWFGVLPLVSGIFRYTPIYSLFEIIKYKK